MTGGLKTFSFFPPLSISTSLFLNICMRMENKYISLFLVFFLNPHRDLDKPHEAD